MYEEFKDILYYYRFIKQNKDGSIDISGKLYNDDSKEYFKYVLSENVIVNKLYGSFYCCRINLKSLKGSPRIVTGWFNCSYNRLTSLEYCPKSITGEFWFNANKITELIDWPKNILGFIYYENNPIQRKLYPIELGNWSEIHNFLLQKKLKKIGAQLE